MNKRSLAALILRHGFEPASAVSIVQYVNSAFGIAGSVDRGATIGDTDIIAPTLGIECSVFPHFYRGANFCRYDPCYNGRSI